MRLRNLLNTGGPNDGTRSLSGSTLLPPVASAVKDWSRHAVGGVLVGRLALSFYAKPVVTQEIDILFPDGRPLPPDLPGFRRAAPRVLVHEASGVEVRLLSPDALGIPEAVAAEAMRSNLWSSGIEIASPSSLAALMLFRLSSRDKTDIVALIKTGEVDVRGFALPQDRLDRFGALVADAANEPA